MGLGKFLKKIGRPLAKPLGKLGKFVGKVAVAEAENVVQAEAERLAQGKKL
jgi:hypothetical protein